jgi:phenylacetate-CoA ligase
MNPSEIDWSREVFNLVKRFEHTQYEPRNHAALIPDVPVLTREALRTLPVTKLDYSSASSGSTGVPVVVQKTLVQQLWFKATNQRELLWRGWDTSRNMAVVTAKVSHVGEETWQFNPYIFPNTPGKIYVHPTRGDLQQWLDSVPCDYLHSYPTIIQTLDTSRLIDVKSTGERGGTLYSSEEAGTIAIECPDNPDVYHVMENIVIELDNENNIIVTDLTHPYLKRYLIGDKGEFAQCHCGRTLQTLKKNVLGRVRNMAVAPDGTRFWPLFGVNKFSRIAPNLIRWQAIQESLTHIVLKVQGDITFLEELNIKQVMCNSLGNDYEYHIVRVEGFPPGKFEQFMCLI